MDLADQLRRRNQAASEAAQAQNQAQAFQGAFPRPQFTTQTPGFGGSIGGSSFQVPGTTQINYGDIIGKGLSNYLGAKANKKATEAESVEKEINQEFMMSTLNGDPQAMKLYGAAQAGLPGASEALAKHIAPKKEALAGFMQANSQGTMDPDLAAEVAPQYGIDPELARKAAAYARQQVLEKEDRKLAGKREEMDYRFGLQKQLKGIPAARAGGGGAGGTERTNAATGEIYEIDGAPGSYGMTPGEKQKRAKMLDGMDDIIMKGEQQIAKFPAVREAAGKIGGLGRGQQVAQFMSESGIPLVSALGMAARSKEAALLHDYANNETLARMAQLGGNDSNEELRRMQASVPNALQSPETMRALLDLFDDWQQRTMAIIKKKRSKVQTGEYFDPRAKFDDPRNIKVEPVETRTKPAVPIDQWLDEQGIQ